MGPTPQGFWPHIDKAHRLFRAGLKNGESSWAQIHRRPQDPTGTVWAEKPESWAASICRTSHDGLGRNELDGAAFWPRSKPLTATGNNRYGSRVVPSSKGAATAASHSK